MTLSRRRFLTRTATLAAAGGAFAARPLSTRGGDAVDDVSPETSYTVRPIGRVENQKGQPPRIVLFERFADGLLGLDGWSHVNVFWWFHKNDVPQKRGILRVHPRGNKKNPLTGVFATRSPVRPNLVALTVCKIVSVEGSAITVERIDAFDGTPVLDLKPLIGRDFVRQDYRAPDWIGGKRKT
ncbi:MAG: tRNA (N6-threonylcarbamoyladenosine(37)-N6)-methyltransferase TrmO [Phycisphaerae bacterium]